MSPIRRLWLITFCCALLIGALAPAAWCQDWLQGRYDAINSGFSPSTLPSSPNLTWTFAGKSNGTRLHPDSGSAAHNGVIFTSADKNPSNVEGQAWSEFYAFDAATGKKLWTYDPNLPGAVHDGMVAVDVDRGLVIYPSHDGLLRALDEATGALVWTLQVCDPSQFVCDLEGGVTMADGHAYYVSNKDFFAIDTDRAGPTVLWTFSRGAITQGVATKPIVTGGRVYFGGFEHFWALDEQTGALIWDRPSTKSNFSYGFNTPHYVNGVLFASASQAGSKESILTAIDAVTGATIWENDLRLGFTVKSAVGYGKWFLGFWKGGGQGGLITFDQTNGKELWRFDRVGQKQTKVGPVNGGPAVADNKVVFGASDGHIYMLDQATGNLLWSFDTGETTHSPTTIADGRFYIGSRKTFRAFGP